MSNAATCTRVNLDKLVCDGRYQRPVEEKRVARIVNNFDSKLLGTLELSKRKNGTFAIIDGQHRFEALKTIGRKQAPALVHEGLSVQQEADLFARTNMGRKALSAVQRFRAQVFSGDPQAVEITEVLTASGFRIVDGQRSINMGDIKAVASIERVYKVYGVDHLRAVIETVSECWFAEKTATDANVINGMALFLSLFGDRFGPEHVERLRAVSALSLTRRAQERVVGAGATTTSAAMADELRRACGFRNSTTRSTDVTKVLAHA